MTRLFFDKGFADKNIVLPDEQSHHLVHVLRAEVGDALELIDGRGGIARATITEIASGKCFVEISQVEKIEVRETIRLVFGIPKSQALDFIIRRCTEIGVAGFQPVLTDHSLRPESWNAERWRKVVAEVAKQCEAPFLPEIAEPLVLPKWLSQREKDRPLILCSETARTVETPVPPHQSGYDLLIGPEGGWSVRELEQFKDSGALPMGLGRNRLRAETAALIAVALLKNKTI